MFQFLASHRPYPVRISSAFRASGLAVVVLAFAAILMGCDTVEDRINNDFDLNGRWATLGPELPEDGFPVVMRLRLSEEDGQVTGSGDVSVRTNSENVSYEVSITGTYRNEEDVSLLLTDGSETATAEGRVRSSGLSAAAMDVDVTGFGVMDVDVTLEKSILNPPSP
jgi:hypothetical protein